MATNSNQSDQVKHYITRATELTALSVAHLIKEKGFSSTDLMDEEESRAREKLIDQAGVDAMRAALTDIPFCLEIVGSEGRKHVHQYGEALPTLEGNFGSGDYKLDMVNDVVEGSKAAKLNTPGAVSVIAVGTHLGVMPTPADIDYMDKLFAPAQLKGKISINKPVEENLAQVVATFGVKPEEITVTIMERDRNAHYINAAQKFGVKLNLIKAGDFLPSILSCTDPEKSLNDSSSQRRKGLPAGRQGINLVIGSGGFEEGVLAAVAAKALGAVGEGKGWSADSEVQKKYSKVWSTDDLVSGKREDCFVSISAITDDNKWFDLKGVEDRDGGRQTQTLTISEDSVKLINKIHY